MNLETYKNNPKTAFLAGLYEKLEWEENEARQMAEKDPSMKELVEGEIASFVEQKKNLEEQMVAIVAEEKRKEDEESLEINEVVLEVRAGAGGDEANIFAHELLEMYMRYADARGWTTKPTEDLSVEIFGKNVYRDLRWETGVHRVQRVPLTEKMGRVHTSTASVAILPIRKKSKFVINPAELEMEFSRAGGKGGQNVNKVESAVRIIHVPTGLDVRSTVERSQAANREKALQLLTAKLEVLKEEEEAKKFAAQRKGQIGTGDRSEKIRTYNFPQDRVTDHRIKQSWHNIPEIMKGKFQPIIDALHEFEKTGGESVGKENVEE